MARSIDGWAVLGTHSADLATGTVPGTSIRLTMHRAVLPLFLALAADYHRTVAPLRAGECGAYAYRESRLSSAWSDHSSGTAVDLNWNHEGAQGPTGGMATMAPSQIAACAALKAKYGVVIWGGDKARGGDYANPVNFDPMHFAIRPGVTSAQVAAKIKALGIRPDGTVASARVVAYSALTSPLRRVRRTASVAIVQQALTAERLLNDPAAITGRWNRATDIAWVRAKAKFGGPPSSAALTLTALGKAHGFTWRSR